MSKQEEGKNRDYGIKKKRREEFLSDRRDEEEWRITKRGDKVGVGWG